jgi:hypothetical protein
MFTLWGQVGWADIWEFVNEVLMKNEVEQAAEGVIAAIEAIELDPKAMVQRSLAWVGGLKYPTPARAADAVRLIRSLEGPAKELVDQQNLPVLRRALWEFEQAAQRLTAPIPEPTWEEHLARWCRDGSGWTTNDLSFDKMWRFVKDGRDTKDRIVGQTSEAVTLASGTVVTRQMLGLQPIERPPQLISAGPPELVGKPIGTQLSRPG